MLYKNDGFNPETIESLKAELKSAGKPYKIVPSDANSEEFVNFYFIGMFEGREVIYDAALYTLRLHHSSEIYELAEHKAAQKFPNFKGIHYEEDENGNLKPLNSDEEEVGWFITEIIMELEEDEAVKVQEFVDIDTNHDFGIGVDAALHLDQVTEGSIIKFIKEFNDDTLVLDETLFSYQSEDVEE
ncbi:hypothetical protein GCM10007049_26640 [Echinicola pacifica]|uniref:Uncharacterized protein n=1 Tax=Echinicola pacifica TaxID=346377 RepID=A0A918Q4Q1_9BACT|nr:hypothetical protein [Echinicola pacifica]GGZ31938.1 hypothetical protein GCM10007049_26640 [Echinicola pacifica]